jgi:tRNA(Met) cytidine acetyltransferase
VIEDLATALVTEARRANERRVLVLSGEGETPVEAARAALTAADVPPAETTAVGPVADLPGEALSLRDAGALLGETRSVVVLDCRRTFRPNALGRVVGAVDGGGLLVVLTPPLASWGDRSDGFDEWLAVPPFTEADVTGRVRRRVAALARVHPGVGIVDVDEGRIERDGLTDPPPRVASPTPEVPADRRFPSALYEACLTQDQVQAVAAFEDINENAPAALVLEADRGRGKSSAAGLAAGALADAGAGVIVTAPGYRNAREVLVRVAEALESLGYDATIDGGDDPRDLVTTAGSVEFVSPERATDRAPSADVLIVDEAAGFPVSRLAAFLRAPSVAFVTTVQGYEGAGRGFSVRFRDRLGDADHAVTDVSLTAPIRYADTDPVEPWAFRSLLLDASPAVTPLVTEATPATSTYESLEPDALLADEHLLRETFGLLVLAHYRTEPDDLARLLDAPNVSARALLHDGHVASVALLAREGNLQGELRADMYEGDRVRGNMIPDVLTTQLRDESAGVPVGQRVLRIATHPAVRNRGLGSHLVSEIRDEHREAVDWLGVGFGATSALVDFWAANGFRTVHCSTTRNDESGEYSAIMLDPCSNAGDALFARHTDWFLDRITSVLTDALDDLDPAVTRAVLRATAGEPAVDLSPAEWRLVAGVPGGAGTIDTDPGPFRELVLRHLVAPADGVTLDARIEQVLVAKLLQARHWDDVADEYGFVSTAECMRAVGGAVGELIEAYDSDVARSELERHG